LSDVWDGGIDFAALFLLLDVYLELQRRFATLLVLRPDLGIPRVPGAKFDVENEYDVASLSLLCHNDLLRAIDDEVAALVV